MRRTHSKSQPQLLDLFVCEDNRKNPARLWELDNGHTAPIKLLGLQYVPHPRHTAIITYFVPMPFTCAQELSVHIGQRFVDN